MEQIEQMPVRGETDAAGRTFSEVIGYAHQAGIALGSRVTLLPTRNHRMFEFYKWTQGIVVSRRKDPDGYGDDHIIVIRKLESLSDWEPGSNFIRWAERDVRVDTVGTGKEPVAGTDYPLCRKEILDAKWARMDHRHQGFTNPATFLAHTQLRFDQRHYREILRMVRQDGSINPSRLQTYWSRNCETTMPDWGKYPEGFPASLCYLYRINWSELAQDFAEHVRELRRYEARRLATT
ncbi:hypothetical protein [Burkholderia cenocepacia]|uniref:hypothetical protein n=1 Tax=Burkholderia cenocepacia TaxID=95486 RepID=UPI000760EE4C|nr:hypothetical protein [Burkholderia cenocepacia]KWU23434.1 hypothetical protein AS149_37225 [Burkholderia cenocepacia]